MKAYRFEVIIFLVEFTYMILELVASRVLSPYFGNSNLVWTTVIAIILLSTSIGNYIGGKIADKENKLRNLKIILLCIATLILVVGIAQEFVISNISETIESARLGAIISTLILFFLPSMFMGFIPTLVLKLKLKDIENAGKTSGRLTAIATIGGITGTFLGGFLLIPNIGSVHILYILAILITLLIPLVDLKIKTYTNICVVGLLSASSLFMFLDIKSNKTNFNNVLNGEIGAFVEFDTEYARIKVINEKIYGHDIRTLEVNGVIQSQCFIKHEYRYAVRTMYIACYDLMFNSFNEIDDVLMLGGGGYTYPKHYISSYQDKKMDVVEIDEKMTEIAKTYFHLNTLIEEFDLQNTKRLRLINQDGRVFVNKNTKKYDAVLNDTFNGGMPAKNLVTIEALQKIEDSLNSGGLYLVNVIGSLIGEDSKFLKAEVKTLQQVFDNVYVYPVSGAYYADLVQNVMVIATNGHIELENTYDLAISSEDIILTDSHCPLENLVPKRYL